MLSIAARSGPSPRFVTQPASARTRSIERWRGWASRDGWSVTVRRRPSSDWGESVACLCTGARGGADSSGSYSRWSGAAAAVQHRSAAGDRRGGVRAGSDRCGRGAGDRSDGAERLPLAPETVGPLGGRGGAARTFIPDHQGGAGHWHYASPLFPLPTCPTWRKAAPC